MKKQPWGIFAGICAMLVFFLTLAFVGIYIIFGAISNQTHSHFSPFQNWWQILIFIFDLLSLGGFVGFFYLYLMREKKEKKERGKKQ